MNRLFLIAVLVILNINFAMADLKVITTYPYIASITSEIVKDKAKVEHLADGNLDPHFIVPKPSLIVKLRNADILIINGAGLEVGWLPPLINQANNPKINTNSVGFLDLSEFVNLIQKPESVSRAAGDVHPEGNPHFHLDPYNIPIIADAITEKLCKIDTKNCDSYKSNNKAFKEKWHLKLKEWNANMQTLKGKNVIQYHKLYDYFINRYQLKVISNLEPLPGIPPNAKHIESIIEKAKVDRVDFIMQDVYHPQKAAKFLAEKINTKVIVVPHDVGSVPQAKDIFSLFDQIVERLTQ